MRFRRCGLARRCVGAILLAAASSGGCLLPAEEASEDRASRIAGESLEVARQERAPARNARWYLVRAWAVEPGEPAPQAPPAPVESLVSDVLAAGLVATLGGSPRTEPGRAIMLRDGQTGFVAIWRGEPCPPFEVAGRPLGGDAAPVDRGFEIAPAVRSGALSLEFAPLFRGLGETGEDLRVGSLAFSVQVAPGELLRLGIGAETQGAVLKALFSGPGGARRELWLRAEVFR